MKGIKSIKKNCYNCKFLEWYDDGGSEYGGDSGYACNKREYRNDYEENKHLAQLEDDSYLEKAKSCCKFTNPNQSSALDADKDPRQ